VVECDLAKVEVAGSNPVSRSIKTLSDALAVARVSCFTGCASARCDGVEYEQSKSGAVPKW
jgi:hypothetical protein